MITMPRRRPRGRHARGAPPPTCPPRPHPGTGNTARVPGTTGPVPGTRFPEPVPPWRASRTEPPRDPWSRREAWPDVPRPDQGVPREAPPAHRGLPTTRRPLLIGVAGALVAAVAMAVALVTGLSSRSVPARPERPVAAAAPAVPSRPVPRAQVRDWRTGIVRGQAPVATPMAPAALGAKVVARARTQLGVPYSWGGGTTDGPSEGFAQGSGIVGFDCSAFVRYAWWPWVHLPRTADVQARAGTRITRDLLRPGDLVFSHGFGHVQLYVGDGQVIQAAHTGTVISISPLPGEADAYVRVTR
jgi:cell wall-associated NlpC family hydrolase